MKKYLFLLISIAFYLVSTAQGYQPLLVEGRTWDVYYWETRNDFRSPGTADRFFVEGDTVIEDKAYKLIKRRTIFSADTLDFLVLRPPFRLWDVAKTVGAMREDSLEKRVYTRAFSSLFIGSETEFLTYDFDLKTGETLQQNFMAEDFVLDTILLVTLNDEAVRRKFVFKSISTIKSEGFLSDFYIEGIGGNASLLLPFNFSRPRAFGSHTGCIKQEQNILFESPSPTGWGCEEILTSTKTELVLKAEIEVFPNPVADKLHIRADRNLAVSYFDIHGRSMGNTKLNAGLNTLDINHWSKGVYFLKIYDYLNHMRTYKVVRE
ncbi:MAG: T9SS type A sorting domain-containing protein [Bacteroidota bacterium]